MPDPDKELWVDLYRMAMMELENAKIAGRIGDARIEIAARLEKLRDIPGLHVVEKQAIGPTQRFVASRLARRAQKLFSR